MNQENKDLLEYALNEKSKYDEVYKYIRDNIVEPKGNGFLNKEVLYTNIEQLYNRARLLDMILSKIAEEG